MASHYTRSKARRLDDVEPDDVASVAISDPILDTSFVRPSVVAAEEPESIAAESAEPVSAPSTPSLEGILSPKGGPGTYGPVGSPQVGITLGYPSDLAGPMELETQARGQTILPQPDMDATTSSVTALSDSGVHGPDPAAAGATPPTTAADPQHQAQSLQPPAPATAAAEGLTQIPGL